MDTSVTIIGLVIALVVAFPLYFTMRSQQVDKEKIKKIFAEFSQGNTYSFELVETYGKKSLAIDKTKKAIILIDLNQKSDATHFVDLTMIKACRIVDTTYADQNDTVARIDFEFHFKDSGKTTIPFYDAEKDNLRTVYVYEEQHCALKWEKIINSYI